MEASSFEKSIEGWLVELNHPQADHRRAALKALAYSATWDDRLIDELKLIARGDPDSKAQSLAKKVLKAQGIKVLPLKQTGISLNSEFWIGFFLCSIFNFVLFLELQFFTLIADNKSTSILQLGINVVLFVYFWLTRKNVAVGILAGFGLIMVIRALCLMVLLSLRCWPDGCAVPP